jgi:hypothetical protein
VQYGVRNRSRDTRRKMGTGTHVRHEMVWDWYGYGGHGAQDGGWVGNSNSDCGTYETGIGDGTGMQDGEGDGEVRWGMGMKMGT